MYLKLKIEASDLSIDDLDLGQLYVDTDGDLNFVVRKEDSDENQVVCFLESGPIILSYLPDIGRLVTLKDVELVA